MKYLKPITIICVIILILVSYIWLGCSKPTKDNRSIEFFINGKAIACKSFEWSYCGYNVMGCSDKLEYECVTNVRIIAPVHILEGK